MVFVPDKLRFAHVVGFSVLCEHGIFQVHVQVPLCYALEGGLLPVLQTIVLSEDTIRISLAIFGARYERAAFPTRSDAGHLRRASDRAMGMQRSQ